MRRIFKDNIPLAELVLRIIMQKPDLKVVKLDVQADMKMVTGARSLTLDVYATDSENRKYDIEVQKDSRDLTPARATYHAAMMAIDNLHATQTFEELPQMYTIFISERDILGEGCALYPIEWKIEISNKSFHRAHRKQ